MRAANWERAPLSLSSAAQMGSAQPRHSCGKEWEGVGKDGGRGREGSELGKDGGRGTAEQYEP